MNGQTVTVTGVDDSHDNGTQRLTEITHTGSGSEEDYGGLVDKVSVAVLDDDFRGIKFSRRSHSIREGNDAEEGYTLSLGDRPDGEVVITLTSEPAGKISMNVIGESRSPTEPVTAKFNQRNWNIPKRVFVRGRDDDDHDHESVTISHSVSGYGDVAEGGSVRISVIDDDTAGLVFTPDSVTVNEGATSTYTVKLATEPTGPNDVVVTPQSSDEKIATVSQGVVFDSLNWDVAKTITVTGGPGRRHCDWVCLNQSHS